MNAFADMPADVVRSSSLNTWQDCRRRWAVYQMFDELVGLGYNLRRTATSVGAHVGTGAHAAVAHAWGTYAQVGEFPHDDDCLHHGVTEYAARKVEDGVLFDDTTQNDGHAEIAIRKIFAAYQQMYQGAAFRPIAVEKRLYMRIGNGWVLSGQMDKLGRMVTMFNADTLVLNDLKTGVRQPFPTPQLGSYDLLTEANLQAPEVAQMTFIRRTRPNTDQPPPLVRAYDRRQIRQEARRYLHQIPLAVSEFREKGGSDPTAFDANPGSFLCGPKYCAACHVNSNFCTAGRAKAMAA